ncbi:MAG: hypothetical protein NC126_09200 [Clostridium sp.]|nr:hypothetical protein [Clostridium sp.]
MIAYKGFNAKLESVLGNGDKRTSRFAPGMTLEVPYSKTQKSGFHCCENPFECLRYYELDGKNRFFKVDAQGDIDEDEIERISCTRITLLEELSPLRFAMEGMMYIINHPQRTKWQQHYDCASVLEDVAETGQAGNIAIARGRNPRVRGAEGSILGLLKEDADGTITECKLLMVSRAQSGKWLSVKERQVIYV